MAIDPKIKQKAEDIRKKIFGAEVRESLASGLEGMSEDVESIKGRQGNVENQFQDVLDETTGKDVISAPEIIAARGGHDNLSQRLLSTDQQLQHIDSHTSERITNFENQVTEKINKEELDLELIRTGEPFNDVTFEKANDGKPVTVDMEILGSPNFKPIDFVPAGIDPEGYAVAQNGRRRTKDGGKSFEEISSSGLHTGFIWFDEQGNAYRSSGKDIYRSPVSAGYINYKFVKVASVNNGFLTGFSFETDGMGGVYFAEYSFGDKVDNFLYSHDWGVTWTKKIIDYNQTHFHTIHFHKPSGNLYLVVGEGVSSWKGLLKSIDRGVNFTKIESMGNRIQPISATTRGKYIVWGKDSSPSGFLLHNTDNDEITELPVENHFGKSGEPVNYTGFYYSKVEMDGVIVSPSGIENSVKTFYPLIAFDGISQRSAILNQHINYSKYERWMFGPDAEDYYYLLDKSNNSSHVFKKLRSTKQTFYATNNTENVTAIEIGAGTQETIGGVPFKKINMGKNDSSPSQVVKGGEKLRITTLFKKSTGGDVRISAMQERADGGYATKYFSLSTNKIEEGELLKVNLQFDVPDNVRKIFWSWEITSGTAIESNHHFVSPLSVQNSVNTDVKFVLQDTKDSFKITKSVSPNYLFKDIIYNTGYSDFYITGQNMPILKVNDLEIGLLRKTSEAESTVVYIKQKGVVIVEKPCIQYGGVLKDEKVSKLIDPSVTNVNAQHFRPAPMRVGVTESSVFLFSSETGETFEFNLNSPIIGLLEIELLGSAYHSPHVFQNVPKDKVRDYLLND